MEREEKNSFKNPSQAYLLPVSRQSVGEAQNGPMG